MSIAIPESREEFIDYCMYRLGSPVIQVEISPEQQEIAVETALGKYYDYHFDGNEEAYVVCPISDTDVQNGYITLEDKVHSVVHILPVSNDYSMSDSSYLFSAQYQFYLNDYYSSTGIMGGNLAYLDSMKAYIATMNRELVPSISFNFNRKTNRIYFNEPMRLIKSKASSVVVKVYKKIDPEAFPDVWSDEFLRDYATALMKKQWASNIRKFSSVALPGGIQLNGDAIYNEAVAEIDALEAKLITDLQGPLQFFVG